MLLCVIDILIVNCSLNQSDLQRMALAFRCVWRLFQAFAASLRSTKPLKFNPVYTGFVEKLWGSLGNAGSSVLDDRSILVVSYWVGLGGVFLSNRQGGRLQSATV